MKLKAVFLLSPLLIIGMPRARAQAPASDLAELQQIQARAALVDLSADYSSLSRRDRAALAEIVRAARIMDPVYMDQQWSGALAMLTGLALDDSPVGRARIALFIRMGGPWDRLDGNKPFVPGVPPIPDGANFYPASAKPEDLLNWIGSLSPSSQERAKSPVTVIRWLPGNGFGSVPDALVYQNEFTEAAIHLRAAASRTTYSGLKTYLEQLADAFRLNSFIRSEEPLMTLDAPILASVGPDYPDIDNLLGFKAAFGGFVMLRDDADMAKAKRYLAQFERVEDKLPSAIFETTSRAKAPLLFIGDLLFASGGAHAGWVGARTSLPGASELADPGERPIVFKNVLEAELDSILVPLAKMSLAAAERRSLSIDARTARVGVISLITKLRPHRSGGKGKNSVLVAEALGRSFPAIDTLRSRSEGLWVAQQFVERGAIDKSLELGLYADAVTSDLLFARVSEESQSEPAEIELNFLLDQGALRIGADGLLSIDVAKAKEAEASLMRQTVAMEADGDAVGAQALVHRLAVERPAIKAILDKAGALPFVIWPRFVSADALLSQY